MKEASWSLQDTGAVQIPATDHELTGTANGAQLFHNRVLSGNLLRQLDHEFDIEIIGFNRIEIENPTRLETDRGIRFR